MTVNSTEAAIHKDVVLIYSKRVIDNVFDPCIIQHETLLSPKNICLGQSDVDEAYQIVKNEVDQLQI